MHLEARDVAKFGLSVGFTAIFIDPKAFQLARLQDRYVNLNPVLDHYIPENACTPKQLRELVAEAEALRSSTLWQRATALLDTYW